MRVLVVDDDPRIVAVMAALLRSENCIIDTAFDGQEALEAAKKNNYDLVISDIAMPKMAGLEFFQNLKKIRPDCPVIFITAYPEFEYMVNALDDGALAFITKPFDNDMMLKRVDQVRCINLERKGREIALKHMTDDDHEWVFNTATLMNHDIFYPLTSYLAGKLLGDYEETRVNRLKLALSIHEALRNALEHGNLELSSVMKPEFLLDDSEDEYQKLLAERLRDPLYSGRKVTIRIERKEDRLELIIRDDGKGFQHKQHIEDARDPDEIGHHGNGILMMRSGVSDVTYNETGNEVTLTCPLH